MIYYSQHEQELELIKFLMNNTCSMKLIYQENEKPKY